ncbi:MAG TPA: alkaline phosphatase family protein, partial [Gemmatimonadales bacterium]|nr:alkaline phosphatase family protein [Gemmatimonadales bacterium]
TGVAPGQATITATSEGKSGTAVVTVSGSGSGFGHVIIVAEENHDYSSVIGNSAMPYLNGLSSQYGLATGYYANAHPSIGNYFELTTGDTIINDDNFTGTVSSDNIVRELVAAGKTWKSYIEGYPSYDANHVPVSYFSDVRNNPAQAAKMVPFTQFATDLANGTLPDFSFITPNLCNDAHNCALSTADAWLQTNIAPLISSTLFQTDGLLIIWWDESASDNTHGGGKVAWTVVSPFAKPGYKSSTLYQHQSTLRLMLKALGVTVFPADAATAPDMGEFFTIPVGPASRVP